MNPLILEKHDQDFNRIRELIPAELEAISGAFGSTHQSIPCDTITVTPDADGDFCSGCDDCPA